MASNTVRLMGGAAGAAALAILVVALLQRVVPVADPAPLATATPAPAAVPETGTETSPAADPGPSVVAAQTGPTVDTFVREADGTSVVAGLAAPGQSVTILLDGVELGQAQADASGSFAVTADIAPSDQPRMLSFSVDGAAPSGERVLVRPQVQPVAEAPVAAPQEATQTAEVGSTTPAETDPAVVAAEQPAGEDAAGAVAATELAQEQTLALAPAPTIVLDDSGARVLPSGPRVMDRVALDAITYDDSGAVQLAGRAPGDGAVRVYVDNKPLTDGPVGPAGDWRLTLPQVDAGTYTLRIDEIADDGSVASRIETPFRRESPADVTALQQDGAGVRVATNTVQPGSTLWAIARENFGDGMMYVAVFEANRDQIRDPDLIYPGQVFVIPQQ